MKFESIISESAPKTVYHFCSFDSLLRKLERGSFRFNEYPINTGRGLEFCTTCDRSGASLGDDPTYEVKLIIKFDEFQELVRGLKLTPISEFFNDSDKIVTEFAQEYHESKNKILAFAPHVYILRVLNIISEYGSPTFWNFIQTSDEWYEIPGTEELIDKLKQLTGKEKKNVKLIAQHIVNYHISQNRREQEERISVKKGASDNVAIPFQKMNDQKKGLRIDIANDSELDEYREELKKWVSRYPNLFTDRFKGYL